MRECSLYKRLYISIFDNLRETLCVRCDKFVQNKIINKNDDSNYNDSVEQNLKEMTKTILIYLSLMDQEKTKNLIIKLIIFK